MSSSHPTLDYIARNEKLHRLTTLDFSVLKAIIAFTLLLLMTFGLNFDFRSADVTIVTEGSVMNRILRVLLALLGVLGLLLHLLDNRSFFSSIRPLFSLSFIVLMGWFFISGQFSAFPENSLRFFLSVYSLIFCYMVVFTFIDNRANFTWIMFLYAVAVLSINYAAVIFFPHIAIHANDGLVGTWRGLIIHKNATGPILIFVILIAVYLYQNGNKLIGFLLVCLALPFLYKTGAKTAMVTLLLVLISSLIAFKFKGFWLCSLTFLSPLILVTVFTFMAVFNDNFGTYLNSYGIDTQFTGRDILWQATFERIQQQNYFGYGMGQFWNSPDGQYIKDYVNLALSWAPNAHNGYLEIYLGIGLIGFILSLIFLIIMPLRAIDKAIKRNNNPSLIMLLTRYWQVLLLTGAMESTFFTQHNPTWAMFIFVLFALRFIAFRRLPE